MKRILDMENFHRLNEDEELVVKEIPAESSKDKLKDKMKNEFSRGGWSESGDNFIYTRPDVGMMFKIEFMNDLQCHVTYYVPDNSEQGNASKLFEIENMGDMIKWMKSCLSEDTDNNQTGPEFDPTDPKTFLIKSATYSVG